MARKTTDSSLFLWSLLFSWYPKLSIFLPCWLFGWFCLKVKHWHTLFLMWLKNAAHTTMVNWTCGVDMLFSWSQKIQLRHCYQAGKQFLIGALCYSRGGCFLYSYKSTKFVYNIRLMRVYMLIFCLFCSFNVAVNIFLKANIFTLNFKFKKDNVWLLKVKLLCLPSFLWKNEKFWTPSTLQNCNDTQYNKTV